MPGKSARNEFYETVHHDNSTRQNPGLKHLLLMAGLCLVPIVLLTGGPVLNLIKGSSFLTVGILLLCPAIHLLMMKNMSHDHFKEQALISPTIGGGQQ